MEGIAASPGLAFGKAYIYKKEDLEISEEDITEDEIEKEIERLENAIKLAEEQLEDIKKNISEKMGEDEAEVISAHQMILDDPELIPQIKEDIKKELMNAEAAVNDKMNEYASMFAEMEDEYMRAREEDIKDVKDRIIRILQGREITDHSWQEDVVIVAEELTPSDTASMDTDNVLAFVTSGGSRTSHSAIMARSLEVPAVVGLGDEINKIKQNDKVIVNGLEGEVLVNPDEDEITFYKKEKKREKKLKENMKKFKSRKAKTKEGQEIEVAGNIGSPKEVEAILEAGGEGIGLFRTEFLYMEREDLPGEEEQFKAYREVAKKMGDKPVVIRTLDIGGDKDLPYLDLPEELNPFLGFRAIRFCLGNEDLFKIQLKALLRASAHGNIKIMYPLISTLEEIKTANEILYEARQDLDAEGREYGNPEVGIMIEVPSAAINADNLAREVDFFSIGTNDLIQYTMAVDRTNTRIADLHSPYHPAVLRLIKETIEAGHKKNIWVGMCGEAAGDEMLLPFLLGAGLDEFSMSAVSITRIKYLLDKWTVEEAKKITNKTLEMDSINKVKNFLAEQREKKI